MSNNRCHKPAGSLSRLRRLNAGWAARIVPGLLMIFALGGCIKNDIPYPRIQPNFVTVEADGLLKPAEIDSANRLVTLVFDETVNIRSVEITSYTLTPGARLVEGNLDQPLDLSKYFICTLGLYQDYDWVIRGEQTIERYVTVENQVGASVIDVGGRRVKVEVSSANGGLKAVKVLTAKLGPAGSTVTPSLAGETIDLTSPLEVTLTAYGEDVTWTIFGEEVTSNVQTVRADAWTNVAWIYGAGIDGADNGVEYRLDGTQEWQKAPAGWITNTGGTFNRLEQREGGIHLGGKFRVGKKFHFRPTRLVYDLEYADAAYGHRAIFGQTFRHHAGQRMQEFRCGFIGTVVGAGQFGHQSGEGYRAVHQRFSLNVFLSMTPAVNSVSMQGGYSTSAPVTRSRRTSSSLFTPSKAPKPGMAIRFRSAHSRFNIEANPLTRRATCSVSQPICCAMAAVNPLLSITARGDNDNFYKVKTFPPIDKKITPISISPVHVPRAYRGGSDA